jgi:membrane protein YdbS with pleckstrin-like domain
MSHDITMLARIFVIVILGLGYLGWHVYSLHPHPVHWIIALYALSFVIVVVVIGISDQRRRITPYDGGASQESAS